MLDQHCTLSIRKEEHAKWRSMGTEKADRQRGHTELRRILEKEQAFGAALPHGGDDRHNTMRQVLGTGRERMIQARWVGVATVMCQAKQLLRT